MSGSSCGSYAGVSTSIKQGLLEQKAIKEYIVLDVLCQHANHLGIATINLKTVAEKTHYSVKTVQRIVEFFIAQLWCRVHMTERLGTTLQAIQVSPEVLYIRPKFQEIACELFQKSDPLDSRIGPESESRIRFQREPDFEGRKNFLAHQEKISSSPPPPPESGFFGDDKNQEMESDEDGIYQRTAPQPKASSGVSQRQRFSPPVPLTPPSESRPQKDLSEYHAHLDDRESEWVAQALAQNFGTRITQARQIVDTYGADKVESAAAFAKKEMQARIIKSPVGLICWWLEKNAIVADTEEGELDG